MFCDTQSHTDIEHFCWAEAHIKIARMTLTIKLDGNWSSFQLANRAPRLSVTDSTIAPSARVLKIRPSMCLLDIQNSLLATILSQKEVAGPDSSGLQFFGAGLCHDAHLPALT